MNAHFKRILLIGLLYFGGWNIVMAYGPYHVYLGELLHFQVIDENGVNLPDVTITVWLSDETMQSSVSGSGAFVCTALPLGQNVIRVSKAGYISENFVVECMDAIGRSVNGPIKIKLRRSPTSSRGALAVCNEKFSVVESLFAIGKISTTVDAYNGIYAGCASLAVLQREAIPIDDKKLLIV